MSANNDKRIQSIYSTETYAHGTSKDLVCRDIKCNNIIKQKRYNLLWWYYKKAQENIIQIGHFLIIHTKY